MSEAIADRSQRVLAARSRIGASADVCAAVESSPRPLTLETGRGDRGVKAPARVATNAGSLARKGATKCQ